MKKVLVATEKPFAPAAVKEIEEIIKKANYEFVLLEKYTDKTDFLNAVKDVDALIIRSDKATKEVIEAGNNLKIIVRAGAGYDNIDLEAASAKKIVAMNTPGQNSNAVAELVIGMMIYHARGCFNGKPGTELKGKKLGIHAHGNVGKRVCEIAKGFSMDTYAFDKYVPKDEIEKCGVTYLGSVEELYKTCQYISLHIPATDETKESINYDLLSNMPKGATLVNTARKEVICEKSLLRIFDERDDFVYISDIAPDAKDQITEKYQGRFYFTPKKMGAQTAEANINAGIASATQIVNFFEKGDKTFQVN
jgi:D-3-phosphoglycerate dehydrogenase